MKWLATNWFKIALVLILAFGFYWYSWRQYSASKYCASRAYEVNKDDNGNFNETAYDGTYKLCMQERGL
jgi:hypothetical protein